MDTESAGSAAQANTGINSVVIDMNPFFINADWFTVQKY
jgi:hypothetical protein